MLKTFENIQNVETFENIQRKKQEHLRQSAIYFLDDWIETKLAARHHIKLNVSFAPWVVSIKDKNVSRHLFLRCEFSLTHFFSMHPFSTP